MTLLNGTRRTLLSQRVVAVAAAPAAENFIDELATMDLSQWGEPFVQGATKQTTDLQLMDIAHWAEPFVRYKKVS